MKKQRSTSLEILRVIFALWVVYYHGFLCTIPGGGFLSSGFLAVDFFFVLAGLFLIKSFNKYETNELLNKRWDKGVFRVIWDKIKSLQIAFPIGMIFVIWYKILDGNYWPVHWGYLWFVEDLLVAIAIFYLAHKLIKKEKHFIIFCIAALVISYSVNFAFLEATYGAFRAIGGLSLGILISYIPKIKSQKIAVPCYVLFLAFAILYAVCPNKPLWANFLVITLCYSALIYFASCVTFSNKYINAFCTISFGLYAYQCILRIIDYYHPLPNHIFFLILIGFVLLDRITIIVYKQIKKAKAAKIINPPASETSAENKNNTSNNI